MKYSLLKKLLIILLMFFSASAIHSADKKTTLVHLRPHYIVVSLSEIEEMSNVVIRESKGGLGFIGYSTIKHNYEVNTIKGEKVVIDYTTGLMWHQSGAHNNLSWKRAKKWVGELNEQAYAGFTDWRLPTLEEAVSLIESSENNGNQYINSVFDKSQWSIWTCDISITDGCLTLDSAWSVNFNHCLISRNNIMTDRKKVRPVRVGVGGK